MARKPNAKNLDEVPELEPDLEAETLAGDIRDWVINRMRTQPRVWSMLSQAEQAVLYEDADRAATRLVRGVIDMIVAHEFRQIAVRVNKFTVKAGEIKGEIEAQATIDNVMNFNSAGNCVLVLAAVEDFAAARAEPDIDLDQPELLPKTME
jgi:hypothetical protein